MWSENYLLPGNYSNLCTFTGCIQTYCTRNSHALNVPFIHTSLAVYTLRFNGFLILEFSRSKKKLFLLGHCQGTRNIWRRSHLCQDKLFLLKLTYFSFLLSFLFSVSFLFSFISLLVVYFFFILFSLRDDSTSAG